MNHSEQLSSEQLSSEQLSMDWNDSCDNEKITLDSLNMNTIDYSIAKKYISSNHYSHSLGSAIKLSLGFFHNGRLVTAIIYGVPVGRNVNRWLGTSNDNCLELVRLFSEDGLPRNTESYCIGRSFKFIKENCPQYKYLISYADPNHGHVGYIYQATNWIYVGEQRRILRERMIFIDGIETHARTLNARHGNTKESTLMEIYGDGLEIKDALKKHVYIKCLGGKYERKKWYSKFKQLPYPKLHITQEKI